MSSGADRTHEAPPQDEATAELDRLVHAIAGQEAIVDAWDASRPRRCRR